MASIHIKRSRKGSSKPQENTKRVATAAVPKPDSNNEDYNIRSPERTQLLTKIKEVICDADVSPAFWAGCQLADMSRLQYLAKLEPETILMNDDSVALLPLQCELLGFELRCLVCDCRYTHC